MQLTCSSFKIAVDGRSIQHYRVNELLENCDKKIRGSHGSDDVDVGL
jgi:hypothetical protein